jgi:hypothetical protein
MVCSTDQDKNQEAFAGAAGAQLLFSSAVFSSVFVRVSSVFIRGSFFSCRLAFLGVPSRKRLAHLDKLDGLSYPSS